MEPLNRVLLVANRTASDPPLVEAVRRRAEGGSAVFHLVVPATPQGLHRVVDPEVAGLLAAAERMRKALPLLSAAAGTAVTGHVGDANPLAAVADALKPARIRRDHPLHPAGAALAVAAARPAEQGSRAWSARAARL